MSNHLDGILMWDAVSIGAFFTALGVACYTHYYKIVQNEYFGYPDVSECDNERMKKMGGTELVSDGYVLYRNGFPA